MKILGVYNFSEGYVNGLEPYSEVYFSRIEGVDFRGKDLNGVLFCGCTLDNCSFEGVNLTGVHFKYCFITSIDFLPKIEESDIAQIQLENCNFSFENKSLIEEDLTITKALYEFRYPFTMKSSDLFNFFDIFVNNREEFTLKETFALSHSIHGEDMFCSTGKTALEKIFKSKDIEKVLGNYYTIFKELYFSLIEGYFFSDFEEDLKKKILEGNKGEFGLTNEILEGFYNLIHSPILEQQRRGINYANKFFNIDITLLTMSKLKELAPLILHEDEDLSKWSSVSIHNFVKEIYPLKNENIELDEDEVFDILIP